MKLRFTLPLSIYLLGETQASLTLSTMFEFKNLTATVTIRPTDTLRQPGGDDAGYFSQASGIDVGLEEPQGVTFLAALAGADTLEDLVDLLTGLANRALLSIRNFGAVPHLREVHPEGSEADALLNRWNVEVSEDGITWQRVRETTNQGIAGGMAVWFGANQEPFRDLNVASWPDIAEAMADSLEPAPEQEFFANCIEHSRERNFRLALVEAIICLEIVLSQFLRAYLRIEKGMSERRINMVLQLGLSGRVAGLLELTAEKDTLEGVDVGVVLTAVEWRNTVIHRTGHLPQVSEETMRDHINAVLRLARRLGRKRDEVMAEPDLKRTADGLAQALEMPAPTLRRLARHMIWAEYFFMSGPPTEADMTRIAAVTGEHLRPRDERFDPTEHLFVRFLGLPWHPTWSWSKGQLRQTSAGRKPGDPPLG